MDDERESEFEQPKKAAAVCYRRIDASIEILLVKAHGGGWIFPKGSLEPGEEPWQAAQREALEEAGVTGEVRHERLTTFLHFKQGVNKENRVAAFLLRVTSLQPPQERERQPTWFSPQAAEKTIVQNRQFKYAEEYKRVIRLAVQQATAQSSGKG